MTDRSKWKLRVIRPGDRQPKEADYWRTRPLAERLAAGPRGSHAAAKALLRASETATLAEQLDADLITGETSVTERQRLFAAFRTGEIDLLVVSKVANFSVDLPEASVAIQVSGTFGSRQEEAQRLGRLLRPKGDGRQAHFYSVVSRDTLDADYAAHRQRFLAEQGYAYRLIDALDLEQ